MNIFINIRDFIYYNRKYFIIGIVVILILVLYMFNGSNNYEEIVEQEPVEKEIEEEESTSNLLIVDIKGEVLTPGIYEVEPSKRVMDIISLAGGLLEEADTSNINLSMKVEDEMVIIIPKKSEEPKESIVNNASIVEKKSKAKENSTGKVSINNASIEELMTVKGIGEVKAKKIIEYRNTNGKFTTLEELTKVSGIGSKTFEKIKEYLTL